MQTEFCRTLGIEFPIFAFTHCRDVVAAVSNAGGFGVLGAVVGVLSGIGVIYLVSAILDWVATLNLPLFIMAGGMALLVSIVAGLYPAWKAARLEPLETLRLG